MNKRWMITAAVACMLILAGCATDRRNQSLQNTLTAYGSALRWGSFAQAASFLDPAYRKAHPLTDLEKELYKQVRVSEYDAGGPIPVNANTVRQVAQIGLINVNTQSARTIVDHQTWKYDPKTRHWWLESGLPDITPGH